MKHIILIISLLFFSVIGNTQSVSTYAGSITAINIGDGGPATDAKLNHPVDVVTNENGDLFIAEKKKIRFVDYDTKIIGQLVTSDEFGGTINPKAITYNNGIVYFLDSVSGGYRVMKYDMVNGSINQAQLISDFNLGIDYGGIVYSNNRLYLTNLTSNSIQYIENLNSTPNVGTLISPISSNVLSGGIAVDLNGDLIACCYNTIIKINVQNLSVTTIVPLTNTLLYEPMGIDVGSDGTIYISDIGNNQIFSIDETGLSVFANDNGLTGYNYNTVPVADAKFNGPFGLTIDNDDNIYIADANNNVVRVINCDISQEATIELSSYSTEDCPDELYFYITDSDTKLKPNDEWVWYTNGCGSDSIGTGDTLYFNPHISQNYFVRGEGECFQPGICTEISFEALDCDEDAFKKNIPTAFSPNKDGVNDVWVIDSIKPNTTVSVYNRWGDLIKKIDNYNNEDKVWDGTTNFGTRVSPGTYFYIIENKKNQITSGWVEVVR